MSTLETLINQMKQKNVIDIEFRFESNDQIDQFIKALKEHTPNIRNMNLSCVNTEMAKYLTEQMNAWAKSLKSADGNVKVNNNLTFTITKKEDIADVIKKLNDPSLTFSTVAVSVSRSLSSQEQAVLQQELGNAFVANPIKAKITKLQIEGLYLNRTNWTIFLKNLGQNTSLQEVGLNETNFNYIQDIKALADLIALNGPITKLRLYSSAEGHAAADVYKNDKQAADTLAAAMKKNSVLEVFAYGIYLNNSELRDDIIEKLNDNVGVKNKRKRLEAFAANISTDNGMEELYGKFHNFVRNCLGDNEFDDSGMRSLQNQLQALEDTVQTLHSDSMITKETADKARNMINYFRSQYQLLHFIEQYKNSGNITLKNLAQDMQSEWHEFANKRSYNVVADTNGMFQKFQGFYDVAKSNAPNSEVETHAVLKNVALAIATVLTAGIALLGYLAVISMSGSWKESGHAFFKNGTKADATRDALDQLGSSIQLGRSQK